MTTFHPFPDPALRSQLDPSRQPRVLSPLARLALGEEAELGPSGCDKPPL